ncbi:MAG: cobyric acid synthase, partial [Candidatus Methylomirabilis sp.]
SRDGYAVAPFKAQNMALNSFATPDGGEIGRSQAVQAEAAGVVPTVEMNPILLKPDAKAGCQVVAMGRPLSLMSPERYDTYKGQAFSIIEEAYGRLAASHDLVVIEGAGSPVEVNLRERDLANMRVAAMANAPVLLLGDIDRGGLFAAIIGTMALLNDEERRFVKGFVVNKFRGDLDLFRPGLRFIEGETGRPVLGVIPYLDDLPFPAEDSLARVRWPAEGPGHTQLRIGVVAVPHLSNDTDFDLLALEPGVSLRFIERPEEAAEVDLLILPGSKNTIDDLEYLRARGFESAIQDHRRRGGAVVGVCGGYQMLGHLIRDPFGIEGEIREAKGLSLLDVSTVLTREKRVAQVRAVPCDHLEWGVSPPLEGYEIHLGVTTLGERALPMFRLLGDDGASGERLDGAISSDRIVWGTYLHGLFDHPGLRRQLLNALRRRKGLAPLEAPFGQSGASFRSALYDRLEEVVRASLDLSQLYAIVDLDMPTRKGGERGAQPRA